MRRMNASGANDSEMARVVRVRDALNELGFDAQILMAGSSTHTAEQAAEAAGCALGQIVKTLAVYVGENPMLALVPGDRRLDDRLVAKRAGVGRKQVRLATPDEALTLTGYPVGGTTPFGMPQPLPVVIDEALRRFEEVWIAAGVASAICPMPLETLARLTEGEYAEIAT